MNDMDETRIKAEIDGIMKGVKDIMKKIDALTPKETPEQDPAGEPGENPYSSNNDPAGKE